MFQMTQSKKSSKAEKKLTIGDVWALLTSIFSFLGPQDLANSESADKTWRVKASDRKLWLAFIVPQPVPDIPEGAATQVYDEDDELAAPVTPEATHPKQIFMSDLSRRKVEFWAIDTTGRQAFRTQIAAKGVSDEGVARLDDLLRAGGLSSQDAKALTKTEADVLSASKSMILAGHISAKNAKQFTPLNAHLRAYKFRQQAAAKAEKDQGECAEPAGKRQRVEFTPR